MYCLEGKATQELHVRKGSAFSLDKGLASIGNKSLEALVRDTHPHGNSVCGDFHTRCCTPLLHVLSQAFCMMVAFSETDQLRRCFGGGFFTRFGGSVRSRHSDMTQSISPGVDGIRRLIYPHVGTAPLPSFTNML